MQGTTVTLTFRRALEAARVPRPSAAPAALQPPRRLLVVDDESALRQTTAALLRTAGHTVYEAGDGPGALAILAAAPVDVVCTDLGMPGMNGWDLARQIKAAHPALPDLLRTLAHDAAETVDSEGRRRTAGAEGGLYLADDSKTKDSWGDCTTSRLSPMDTVTPG